MQAKEQVFIQKDISMANYTTYKTGGKAEYFCLPKNIGEIKQALNFAKENKLDFYVLGLGSNILVGDLGIKGLVCCLKDFEEIKIKDNIVYASAGTPLDKVISTSVLNNLGGLEKLSGIPGSVGGAVFMNAGAFNGETWENIISVEVLKNGEVKTIKKEDVNPSYRKVFGLENCLILSATWVLKTPADKNLREEILQKRKQKQPLEYPSAGSVFKRPQGDYASRLIDVCNLRGLTIGGAQVSKKHAGFIINYDNATPQDIKNLMQEIQKTVKEKTGFSLELEQILWGKFKN
jgi:UDP-N-acetylmuramate dehydrogenase